MHYETLDTPEGRVWERIAFNLCAEFGPDYAADKQDFARAAVREYLAASAAYLGTPVKGQTSDLVQALSRLAGNRQSDGVSSLVSSEDRGAIINGCHDLMIAYRQAKAMAGELAIEALRELEAKAIGQKAHFNAKQHELPCLEDFTDDDGNLSLPTDIALLLRQAEANGRYSEADWWLNTIRSALHPTSTPVSAPVAVECHGLDTAERVCFYEQDFYVLSNFSSFQIEWTSNWRFPTSEHVYHWLKFATGFDLLDAAGVDAAAVAKKIQAAPSAHEAFKIAERQKELRRPDWDAVKVDFMRKVLRAKARQHEYVRRKLLATGDRELVENSWRDDFWGWGPNRDGKNMLGKLWMELRAEIRASETAHG